MTVIADKSKENYAKKLEKEKNFGKYSLKPISESAVFAYATAKVRMARVLTRVLKETPQQNPRLLIAPIGAGDDVAYVQHLSCDISGVDISEDALRALAPHKIKTYVGDMQRMDFFADNYFDIVAVPLFFHHFRRYGFDPFLKEINRVLKPGGRVVCLEPGCLYPLSWLFQCLKGILCPESDGVEGEGPFLPSKLLRAMARCGFKEIKFCGASFCHNRIPMAIGKIVNSVSRPFLDMCIIKYFCWLGIFCGKKE